MWPHECDLEPRSLGLNAPVHAPGTTKVRNAFAEDAYALTGGDEAEYRRPICHLNGSSRGEPRVLARSIHRVIERRCGSARAPHKAIIGQ